MARQGGQYGDIGLGEIVTDNLFDKIHADPRWLPFLRKIGKAPEQLAKIEFKVRLPQLACGWIRLCSPQAHMDYAGWV